MKPLITATGALLASLLATHALAQIAPGTSPWYGGVVLGLSTVNDSTADTADALELPRFATGGTSYLKRLTMIVRNGTIYRVIYPVHPPDAHAEVLLRSLRSVHA